MSRLPFKADMIPDRAANESSAPSRGEAQALTVSQVARLIKDALAAGLPSKLRVVGEVSNFSDRQHWFFSLKDDGSSLRCVCFASAARRVGFKMSDGMQVVATGRIDLFDQAGNVQLYVDKLEPVGVGELELRFRALCEELKGKGYFEIERKKALPLLPRKVAVVTSRSGAALQDVINTASRRWAGCRLLLFDVRVQGDAAPAEVAQAINALSKDGARLGIDAVILTRGGGSIEDLWAFNERVVADAIYRCRLPIVAAIGHETDTTIAELVADVRCATPTQAAMTLIPDRRALDEQLEQASRRLSLLTMRQLQHARHRLDAAARHAMFRRPKQMVAPLRDRLELAVKQLATLVPQRVRNAAERLEAMRRHLESIGPQRVLERGYSYTLGHDGRVVRKADDVESGELITTVLADGRVVSRVTEGDADPAPAKAAPRPKRRKRAVKDDGPGLF